MTRYVIGIPLLLVAITALDSTAVAAHTSLGQPLAVAGTLVFWALMLRRAGWRLRRLMVLGLVAATAGEVVFSLGLGMYRYRLGSIPLYVPPGHTLLYAAIFVFVRRPWVHQRAHILAPLLFLACTAYTLAWYQVAHDRFGLCCFALFALLWLVNKPARLFFAAMYLLVAFLEQWGTHFGCWRWPPELLGHLSQVPSGNPPSGVALFYVLFDLSCLALYFFVRWRSFERWVARSVHLRARANRA